MNECSRCDKSGYLMIGPDGYCDACRRLSAEEYRVTVRGPPGTRPPYEPRRTVVRPRNGVLRVEVSLRR